MNISIERVRNGWLATIDKNVWIFQDEECDAEKDGDYLSEADALKRLLEFVFSDYLESEVSGGIVLDFVSEGTNPKEENEEA
tara:strand:- start:327 stop:572 length:246 start_codon:yes stop_codon:yes gene_type:complete